MPRPLVIPVAQARVLMAQTAAGIERPTVRPARATAGKAAKARGDGWEKALETLLGLLERRGVCTWWRTPEPLRRIQPPDVKGRVLCVPTREGPPDYLVLFSGVAIALEAKQTATSRWPLRLLAAHQAASLDAFEAHQGVGAIALQLGQVGYAVPWSTLGPRWHTHAAGQAGHGEASLDHDALRALRAVPIDPDGRWLRAVTGRS